MMNNTYFIGSLNIQETKTLEHRQKRREGRRKAWETEQIDSEMHQYHKNFTFRLRNSAFGLPATETRGTSCPTTSFVANPENSETNQFILILNQVEEVRLLSPVQVSLPSVL